jgi:hypothetical protein
LFFGSLFLPDLSDGAASRPRQHKQSVVVRILEAAKSLVLSVRMEMGAMVGDNQPATLPHHHQHLIIIIIIFCCTHHQPVLSWWWSVAVSSPRGSLFFFGCAWTLYSLACRFFLHYKLLLVSLPVRSTCVAWLKFIFVNKKKRSKAAT